MEKGVKRWLVDISDWKPLEHDVLLAMSVLPHHEHSAISRFAKLEDQKRALVSRLLQYSVVHNMLGIPLNEINILRTPEGKPYLDCDQPVSEFPNFNFSVSHHGDYVAIASEPLCLVGLDIVHCLPPIIDPISKFIQHFSSYFSRSEWEKIMNSSSGKEALNQFYRYWSLKEAFGKAIGTGMGYKSKKVEFHHHEWSYICAKLEGKELDGWRFWLFDLPNEHLGAIARGHPSYATDTYRSTLKVMEFDEGMYDLGLHLTNPNFVLQTVQHLTDSLCHQGDQF